MNKEFKLKFYADGPGYQNKQFNFNLTNPLNFQRILAQFIRSGNKIRSAFLVTNGTSNRLRIGSNQKVNNNTLLENKVQINKVQIKILNEVPVQHRTLSIKNLIEKHKILMQ